MIWFNNTLQYSAQTAPSGFSLPLIAASNLLYYWDMATFSFHSWIFPATLLWRNCILANKKNWQALLCPNIVPLSPLLLPPTSSPYFFPLLLPPTSSPYFFPLLLPPTSSPYFFPLLLPPTSSPYFFPLLLPPTSSPYFFPLLLPPTSSPYFFPLLLPPSLLCSLFRQGRLIIK